LEKDYFCQFYRKFKNETVDCLFVHSDIESKKHYISNSYYIGVDWLVEKEHAIYVEPKLNRESNEQTDYLKMLFSALKHPEVAKYTNDLFEIKWDKPAIDIDQKQDLLTPLLVVQFLRIVHRIVQKGLKKSYYKVEQNLYSRVKGKVLVSKTIKQNILKNKSLNTICSFDEFGYNSIENRLLKKALVFVQRYLPTLKNLLADEYSIGMFNYINPAFEFISDEVNLHDVKHANTNIFYKEYEEAIRLAKMILKRFGYNIHNTENKSPISTPPFWIDMSKLFELYVLGKLIDKFPISGEVIYNKRYNYLIPDYLINSKDGKYKMVVDAKYKPRYDTKEIEKEDLRQVAGYARLQKVYEELGITDLRETIECLIIYSTQNSQNENFHKCSFRDNKVNEYTLFFKEDIKLPIIKFNSK
jgi:5-methylcytosine-specific restriction enzyme subunit McrC